jgi:hypothetical protein
LTKSVVDESTPLWTHDGVQAVMIGFKDVLLFSVFRDTAHCVVVDADAEERRDILRISEDELLKPTRMAQTCLLVGLSERDPHRRLEDYCMNTILTDYVQPHSK